MAGERSLKGSQKHNIAEGRQMGRWRNRSRDCIVGRDTYPELCPETSASNYFLDISTNIPGKPRT